MTSTVEYLQRPLAAWIVALVALGGASTSMAQTVRATGTDDSGDALQEVVVTAQKRSERVQDVPMSLSVFDANALAAQHVTDLEDLSTLAAGVQISTREQKIQTAIRGISVDEINGVTEQPVAANFDGFYVSRSNGLAGSFIDIDRVEILKGPQGTLYGRNATAGAINIIPKKPGNDFELEAAGEGLYITDAGDGKRGSGFRTSLIANLPINDQIHTRFDILKVDRDGSFTGLYPDGHTVSLGGENSIYGRAQLAVDFSSSVNWLLSADTYGANDRAAFIYAAGQSRPDVQLTGVALGFQNCGRCRTVYIDKPISNRPRNYALMSTLTWAPSEHLTLRSLTQYRDNKYDVHGEFDGTWAPISEFAYLIRSKSESQEFQAVFDQGAFKGIAGLYLFNEKQNVYQFFYLGAIAADADLFLNGTGQTRAGAVFGDLTYSLTENFDVTLGGRYSYERRDATQDSSFDFGGIPVVTDMQRLPRLTFKAFTPKLVLKYQFDKDLNFYVSAQKGFRSGGYNVASLGDDAPFQPEKIWDFEGGVKTVLFDRRLDVNAALFYDKYTDLQLQDVIITTTVIRNAASAHIRGIDLDGQWRPFDRGVKFDYSVELLSAKFTQGKLTNPQHAERGLIQLDGRYLPRAPKISFTIGAEYTWDMPRAARLTATASGTYKSHQYFTEFNDPLVAQDSYWLLRAGLRYDFEKNWAVTFYGENLLNKYALTAGDPSSAAYGYQLQGAANPSRTLGLRLDYRL